MGRRAKSSKGKAEPKRSPARKPPKGEGARVRELEKRLAEALEQQTATSEVLRVISSSPTDIQPVLDTLAESAARLCEAFDAEIFRRDGDSLILVAHHGPIPSRTLAVPLVRETFNGRAVLDAHTLHVADLPSETHEFPRGSQIARQHNSRAQLSVPLMREGVAIGAISLRRTEAQLFTDRQVALLQTFADQAVIAIENVRLFTELQEKNRALTQAHGQVTEALEQQTATSEILRVISSSPADLQPVFDTIARSAAELCGAFAAAVYRLEAGVIHFVAHHSGTPQWLDYMRRIFPADARTRPPGQAALDRTILHSADVENDSLASPELREAARVLGFRRILYVPMLGREAPLGAIAVSHPKPGLFPDSYVQLLQTFADQAVIAIENVRLFTELEARNRDLTEALDQQTATSDILRVISSSPTDVQPVFETIARSATTLCEADLSGLYPFDGDLIHFAAEHGRTPVETAAAQRAFPQRPSRLSVTARAILTAAVVQVADVSEDPELADSLRMFRTVLSVPMLREGRPLGAITVARRVVRPFTNKQIALLQTFAEQAVIAIENVRLFTELGEKNRALTQAHAQVSETLEQQTATSEILRVISQSPTDVQPVFDTIVRNAARLCGALYGTVARTEGELIHLAAQYNATPDQANALRHAYPIPLSSEAPVARIIRAGTVYRAADVEAEPEWQSRTEEIRNANRARGVRSQLAVPMLRQGIAIGAINLTHRDVGAFSDAHVELVKTFADQAVIAIENVRLFTELEARTAALTRSVDQLTALGEVGRAVSSTLDLETVLTTIVSRAVELSGLDGGVVFEYDEATEEFVQRVATETAGTLAEARRTVRIQKGEGVVGRTALTLEPVQVPDITVPGAHGGRLRDTLIESGVRAVLAVPMVYEGRLIGSLGVTRNRPGEFPAETIELLRTFATQSALAIQNARLFREIEDKSRQLEAASQHKSEFLANMSHELRTPLNAIIGFSEVLNERMFGELNDKQAEYLKDIYASGQHLLSLINDILDLSKVEAGRMELEVAEFDLPSAIDNALTLVRERATRRGITLGRTIDDRLGMLRGDERKVKQVLLNLLSNALKFTPEGGRIDVGVHLQDGAAEVSVADTGVGIAPEDQEAIFEEFRQVGTADKKVEGTGLGLALSRKFIELHGGRIWVQSKVGKGSTFNFTLPMS